MVFLFSDIDVGVAPKHIIRHVEIFMHQCQTYVSFFLYVKFLEIPKVSIQKKHSQQIKNPKILAFMKII